MNQKQLIEAVQARAISLRDGMHISKADIEAAFASLAEITMEEMTAEGGEVPLPGVGKLKVALKPARAGRNPATGAAMEIPARTVVKFSAAKLLKDALA